MKGICVGSDHEKVLFRIGIEEVLGVFFVMFVIFFFGDLFMKSLSGFFLVFGFVCFDSHSSI